MSEVENAARELYALEAARPFDADQLHRWQSLAKIVFPRIYPGEQRASARLRGHGSVRLSAGDGSRTFEVVDVSWGGIALKGPTEWLHDDGVVRVTAIRSGLSREWQPVDLECRVTAVRGSDGAALALSAELDAQRRHDYFMHAYYPLYLDHLRALARLAD